MECTMAALSVGVIGIGAFGSRVALRLLWNGFHTLQLYDVNDISTRQFTNDYGGMLTGSPKMMAQTCDVVITVLPSAAELREVCFGWENLAKGFSAGGIVINLGIVDALEIVAIARDVIRRTGEGRADLTTLLREEVLTRRFQSARALGMIRGNIELAAKLAAALETASPMLEATKAAWCEADAALGSGADHTAI